MISQIKQKGFTIVELLIVIVIIAILAAISMAAYTNITARANNSTAAASAKAVRDVATTFNGANTAYPTTRAQFVSGHSGDVANAIAKLPSDIAFVANATNQHGATAATAGAAVQALTGTAATKTVTVYPCGSPVVGMRIYYKDFLSTTVRSMDAGDCSTGPTSTTAAIL